MNLRGQRLSNKGLKNKEQADERRLYAEIKTLINNRQLVYNEPKKQSFVIVPVVAQITNEKSNSFKSDVERMALQVYQQENCVVVVALPLCTESEQNITQYVRMEKDKVAIFPLSMLDINSFRRIQNVLLKLILGLGKEEHCLSCGGTIRVRDNQYVCNNCSNLILTKTKCPNPECKHEYHYLGYDVPDETILRMQNLKELDFYQLDGMFKYKNIVNMSVETGKIRSVCPCCGNSGLQL